MTSSAAAAIPLVVPPLETPKSRLMDIASTLLGRLAMVVIFTGLMLVTRVQAWWLAGAFLAALSIAPQYRRPLLTLAAMCWVFVIPPLLSDPHLPGLMAQIAHDRGAQRWMRFWPAQVALVWMFGF